MAADPLATVIYLGSSAAAHTCTSMVVTFWLNCSRIENKFKSNSSCNHHLNHCVITACCHSQLIHRDIFEFNIFLIWVLVCWWWRFDWSFACLIAVVVTTTSVILSSNKIQNRDTLVRAYPGCPLINEHSYSFQRILQNNWKHTHAHTSIIPNNASSEARSDQLSDWPRMSHLTRHQQWISVKRFIWLVNVSY